MANHQNLHEIFREASTPRAGATDNALLAIALRERVEVATWKRAAAILGGSGLPPLPPAPGAGATEAEKEAWSREFSVVNGQRSELIAWAQQVIGRDPFKLMLALASPTLSKTDLLARTDDDVAALIDPLVQLLAKGLQPGR
jgi:hypothetical protein